MRQNIIAVRKYNSGMHRTYTSFKVNDTVSTDIAFSLDYGYRQKLVSLGFITDSTTESTIASALVNEFKTPKIELEVELETSTAKTIDILDTISINYPLRIKRFDDNFLPVIGDTKIGDTDTALPYKFGNNYIDPNVAFKVIEISENPTKFTTILKLRQTNDGFLSAGFSSLVGFAKIGFSAIGGAGTSCDSYNFALLGGAKVGCTNIS